MIISLNPATGAELARFEPHDASAVDAALTGAVSAQAIWARTPLSERVELLRRMARVLRAGKERYGLLITQEMGKPLPEAEAEVEKCAWNCDFYADSAPRFLADEVTESNASESAVVF
ncbi:aldehyde dehydrogenase family protein, partial [Aquabacter cavernae]|uniref:aldehyde dehydrogenase family protein n=1 Tax=Aquabacter cavernae TaxID=2496029 RepID=UPI000F8C8962